MHSNIFKTPEPGFCFENTFRNAALDDLVKGKKPKPTKTGTTIAGVVFKDGVVLGADTRATSSEVIADKMCAKIHYLAPNIYCCGAGTAADTQKVTELISSNLTIFKMNSGRNPRVIMAVTVLQDTLFRYHGKIGANLLLGGVDCTGGHLYDIGPYGDMDKVPFLAMGSGNLPAMGILEDGFKSDMDLESAKHLVRDAINAGIMNDLGSGHNIDLCVITRNGVDYIRPYQESAHIGKREGHYKYNPGTTAILTEKVQHFEMELIEERVQSMETS